MINCVERVHATHSPGKRMDIQSVEQVSERAALLLSCVEEARLALPIPLEKLQQEWAARWIEGDSLLDSELQVLWAQLFFAGVWGCDLHAAHARLARCLLSGFNFGSVQFPLPSLLTRSLGRSGGQG